MVTYEPRTTLRENAEVFFRASYDAMLKHARSDNAVEKAELASDITGNFASVAKLLKDYEGTISNDRERQQFELLQQTHLAFATASKQFVELGERNDRRESIEGLRTRLELSYSALVKATKGLVNPESVGSSLLARSLSLDSSFL